MNPTLVIPSLLIAGFSFFGYGPIQDHSEYVSARLTDDSRTVLFTYHEFTYRSATGWRAFPDGGIPRYLKDINIIGTYDTRTHAVKTLRRQKNSEWQPGNGLFAIQAVNGAKALVGQGGQLRGDFKLGIRYLLIEAKTGKIEDLDLKADLARFGRDAGQIYIVDPAGTLLFITLSLQEAKDPGASRNRELVPEIWVRTAAGAYFKAAASAHYECTQNGEVIYWEPSTRAFMAVNIANRQTRRATEFRSHGFQDVFDGVILSSDHQSLQIGHKAGGEWKYQPPVKPFNR